MNAVSPGNHRAEEQIVLWWFRIIWRMRADAAVKQPSHEWISRKHCMSKPMTCRKWSGARNLTPCLKR